MTKVSARAPAPRPARQTQPPATHRGQADAGARVGQGLVAGGDKGQRGRVHREGARDKRPVLVVVGGRGSQGHNAELGAGRGVKGGRGGKGRRHGQRGGDLDGGAVGQRAGVYHHQPRRAVRQGIAAGKRLAW